MTQKSNESALSTSAIIIDELVKELRSFAERESWNRYSARNREQKREYQKKYYKRNKPKPKAEDAR